MERIAPLAKILAEANGIEWQRLSGTGEGGMIVEQDILNYLSRIMSGEEEPPATPVDAPPSDWLGGSVPSADMLSQAGVDSDIAAFVEQARTPAPQVPAVTPPPNLEGDSLEFELDDEEEEINLLAEPLPAVPTPPVPATPAPASVPAPAVTPGWDWGMPAPQAAPDLPEFTPPTLDDDLPVTMPPVSDGGNLTFDAPSAAPEVPSAAVAGTAAGLGSLLSQLYHKDTPEVALEASPAAPALQDELLGKAGSAADFQAPALDMLDIPAPSLADTPELPELVEPEPVIELPEPAVSAPQPVFETPAPTFTPEPEIAWTAPSFTPEPVQAAALPDFPEPQALHLPEVHDVPEVPQVQEVPEVPAVDDLPPAQVEFSEPLHQPEPISELPPVEVAHVVEPEVEPAVQAVVEPQPVHEPAPAYEALAVTIPEAPQPALEPEPVSEPAEASAATTPETHEEQPAAPIPVPVPAAPAQPVWFGAYLRRDANLTPVSELRAQLVSALGQDVPLAFLVARAAQRHAHLLNLHQVAIHDTRTSKTHPVNAQPLRNSLTALSDTRDGTPDLLVVDAGALDLDDLHYPHTTTLSLGRNVNGHAALTLNGNVDAARAAQFLTQISETLEQPLVLIV